MVDEKLKTWYSGCQAGGTICAHIAGLNTVGVYRRSIRDRAIEALQEGYPVIVGIWIGTAQHYAVVTKHSYRYVFSVTI